MNLSEQVKFATVYSNFSHQEHAPCDAGKIIELIRENKNVISDEAKRKLLQIPLNMLETHVELKKGKEHIWTKENGYYFSENCSREPYHSKFKSEEFDLATIADYLKEIIGNEEMLNSDFYLRNPEVILLEDVQVKKYGNFRECGLIYKMIIEEAFEL